MGHINKEFIFIFQVLLIHQLIMSIRQTAEQVGDLGQIAVVLQQLQTLRIHLSISIAQVRQVLH